jgi:hypothetical protein
MNAQPPIADFRLRLFARLHGVRWALLRLGFLLCAGAFLFWPPLRALTELWRLEAQEEGVLALAEGRSLHHAGNADSQVRAALKSKERLLALGPSAVEGLMEKLAQSIRSSDRFHHRRAYAHILCAIGDPRALGVLERVREGDVYVEACLLSFGRRSAAPALIEALKDGHSDRGPRPRFRYAAGPDRPAREVALEALRLAFDGPEQDDFDIWNRWWRQTQESYTWDVGRGRFVRLTCCDSGVE